MRKYYLASVVVALLVACGLATAGEHTVTLQQGQEVYGQTYTCLLYTSPSPRDRTRSRMPSSA